MPMSDVPDPAQVQQRDRQLDLCGEYMAQRGVPGPAHLLNLGAKAHHTAHAGLTVRRDPAQSSACRCLFQTLARSPFTPSKPDSGWPP
jgi:hypothetical protein